MAGGFFIHAAATQDSDKAGGLAKALVTLLQQPFGPWMVGLVGCGMVGFGLFCGFEGRYRKT
jgi:formate hydrogenlyase subunit 3/multisubunit Na+/H+ antiporter MnhD subunit